MKKILIVLAVAIASASLSAKTEYKVVYVPTRLEWSDTNKLQIFEDKVNRLISEGWKPIGGVAVDGSCRYQALIREVEDGAKE